MTSTQNNSAHTYQCRNIVTIPAHHADSHYFFCLVDLRECLIDVKIDVKIKESFQSDLLHVSKKDVGNCKSSKHILFVIVIKTCYGVCLVGI